MRSPEESSAFDGNGLSPREGAWIEAITLFRAIGEGDLATARRLRESTRSGDRVFDNLLRMLAVFLRGEHPDKLRLFLDASARAGPPPENR